MRPTEQTFWLGVFCGIVSTNLGHFFAVILFG